MTIVRVNLGPLVATITQVMPKASDRAAITRQLGAAAMHYWKRTAMQTLRSTSRDYVAGLQHQEHGESVAIVLNGTIPNMVEQGWKGGDLRDWLLKGPRAKSGKDGGRYNTVPFRHGSPGSSGRNVGIPMPKAIHNVAKHLSPTLSRPGGLHGYRGGQHVVYGQRLHPDVRRMGKQAKEILTTKHRPWHSTSIYMGMIRQEKMYSKAKQSSYTTFRRISSKVAKGGEGKHWFHPGIQARNLAGQTAQHVAALAPAIIQSVIGR